MVDPRAPALMRGVASGHVQGCPLMLPLVAACGGSEDPPIQRSKDQADIMPIH
jgi:hypothetical protein